MRYSTRNSLTAGRNSCCPISHVIPGRRWRALTRDGPSEADAVVDRFNALSEGDPFPRCRLLAVGAHILDRTVAAIREAPRKVEAANDDNHDLEESPAKLVIEPF